MRMTTGKLRTTSHRSCLSSFEEERAAVMGFSTAYAAACSTNPDCGRAEIRKCLRRHGGKREHSGNAVRSGISSDTVRNPLWLGSNEAPVFFTHIVVDFHRRAFAVDPVCSVPSRAGNPVMLTALDLVVVRLQPISFQTLEVAALVVDRAPGFGKRDTTNSRRTGQTASLALDIHDPCFHGLPICVPLIRFAGGKSSTFRSLSLENMIPIGKVGGHFCSGLNGQNIAHSLPDFPK